MVCALFARHVGGFSRGELLGSPRSRDGFSVGLGNLVSPEGRTHRPILLYPLRPDLFAQELDPTATVHRSVEGDTHTHTHTHTERRTLARRLRIV